MNPDDDNRPDPQALLDSVRREEQNTRRGKLKIFFGMCAGVGKTYDMLKAGLLQQSKGINVLAGIVETHGRKETEALLQGLSVLPRKQLEYKGSLLKEFDLDAALARLSHSNISSLILVDELAHTNVPGSRHTKRYQDILELLDAGIDVYTTVNVQHLESRAEAVAQIAGVVIHETVPDSVFEAASEIELVDISPDELLKRLDEGKVYGQEQSKQASRNFFRKGNLTALREMALRLTAERVDHQLRELMKSQRIAGPWKSGQRLLAAISSSPNSVSLVRWARRAAYAMDATWIAVHVGSSKGMRKEAGQQLAKNIALARELGAEIITTADEDIARGILRVAREQNATQVLVGKTSTSLFWRKSLPDKLIAHSGNLDVVVVGGTDHADQSARYTPPIFYSTLNQYLLTAALAVALAAVFFPLQEIIGYQTISLLLLFAVALLSLRFNTGPVILAAGISALLWNFLFIPPRFTFSIGLPQDILMFFAYFVIAAVTGVLTSRIRARERVVRTSEKDAVALYALTKDLSTANSLDDVVNVAVTNFTKFFNAQIVICLSERDGDIFSQAHSASSLQIDPKEFHVAAWVYWNEKKAGKFTDTLPFAEATYYPFSGPRYPLGVIGIKIPSDRRMDIGREILLENFVSQISSSLEREQLNDIARKALVVAESERLYKNLFDSISHEFKTPIASILGSAENLLNSATGESEMLATIKDMYDAAERLNRLVANLLDMTRLESGLLKPKPDWCDLSDLIHTTVRKYEHELAHHVVDFNSDASMPPIKLDYGLVEQVLANLLLNVAAHTPAGTHVSLRSHLEENSCSIEISDDGPGIPEELSGRIFEKFYRRPGSRPGGMGLGLSIVQGFVESMGGKVSFVNRKPHGALFTITLPTVQSHEVRPS